MNDVVTKITPKHDLTWWVKWLSTVFILAGIISRSAEAKSLGIKMVRSGEGSDELFVGYLFFHKAPSAIDFHEETVRKLDKLHQYDCLRANKSLCAWGIEGRVPFLDLSLIHI